MKFSGIALLLNIMSWVAAAVFKTPITRKHIREELEANTTRKLVHWKQEFSTRK
jgi:hypothetical protein